MKVQSSQLKDTAIVINLPIKLNALDQINNHCNKSVIKDGVLHAIFLVKSWLLIRILTYNSAKFSSRFSQSLGNS